MSDDLKTNYTKLNKRYQELKQQIAEKEETIEKINKEFVQAVKDWKSLVESKNQEKISFAVEKLQETKKSLRDKVCLMKNDEHYYPQNAIHWQDVVAIIDNQIASLKKGVE